MADLTATYSVMPSLLTRPLLDGEIGPKGISLEVQPADTIDGNSRKMLDVGYDIGEMAIATYIKAREQGVPVVGLPLFTSGRRFLQPGFQLAAGAGMRDLSELKGRTVGTAQYWLSSSIWQRQILRQVYGVDAEDMTWLTYQPERMASLRVPDGVEQRLDTSGRSPQELAETGEIVANLSPGGGPQPPAGERSALVPAFPDRFEAQRAYFDRTGIFPIMHITVVSQELIDRDPWVVESLADAYLKAKELARARNPITASPSPGSGETTEEMVQLMGDDPWKYGIAPNRAALEALAQGAIDQQLVGERPAVESWFPKELPEELR